MENLELRVCPFCGGAAFFDRKFDRQLYKFSYCIECVDCEAIIVEDEFHLSTDALLDGEEDEIKKELTKKWNRRITDGNEN